MNDGLTNEMRSKVILNLRRYVDSLEKQIREANAESEQVFIQVCHDEIAEAELDIKYHLAKLS